MEALEFEKRIREMLPTATDESMMSWEDYADEHGNHEEKYVWEAQDEYYAGFVLAYRRYGSEIASMLFELPSTEGTIMNPFELPGAAKMLASGMKTSEVTEEIDLHGYDVTPDESNELCAIREELRVSSPERGPTMN